MKRVVGERGATGMRCWAEVDVGALRHNLRALRRIAGRGMGLIPAIKANAYGHGVGIVGPVLAREGGVSMLGVANVSEALEVGRLGVRTPILILGACLKDEVGEVIRGGFEPMISSVEEVGWFDAAARRAGCRARVHVKVDTGMGRLGVWHEEAMGLLEKVAEAKALRMAAVCTHFACADSDAAFTRRQWGRFEKVRAMVGRRWPAVRFHAANSAALLGFPEMRSDMARPGIALYGASPSRRFSGSLRPVMTWKVRVTLVREVEPGRTLSYGATFTAPRRMRVAVVAVGYGDGYARAWSNRGTMLVNGRRCPVVGRVTMDQTLLDVTRAGDVRPGDPVVLMGPGLPVEELARGLKTISYEVFTDIGGRVSRVAVGE
ncbi:MAG TPA: alanine racemase [Verrucomicrobiae bacterium]|nr:alanine racemase [Verrucomicrobiae bacterium]